MSIFTLQHVGEASAQQTMFYMRVLFRSFFRGWSSTLLIPRNVLHAAVVVVVLAVGVQDICETPVVATAQNVVITGNHRGIRE